MYCSELIEEVARVRADWGSHANAVHRLSGALTDFTGSECNRRYVAGLTPTGNYTRELLNSPDDEFQVVLVLWAPGHGSPIHDHDETIGVVSSLMGETEEIKYAVVEDGSDEVQLTESSRFRIAPSRVTELLPEPEKQLHRMVNETDSWAATVHVYLFGIDHYRIFEPSGENRYQQVDTRLWFDRTDVGREMTAVG